MYLAALKAPGHHLRCNKTNNKPVPHVVNQTPRSLAVTKQEQEEKKEEKKKDGQQRDLGRRGL